MEKYKGSDCASLYKLLMVIQNIEYIVEQESQRVSLLAPALILTSLDFSFHKGKGGREETRLSCPSDVSLEIYKLKDAHEYLWHA